MGFLIFIASAIRVILLIVMAAAFIGIFLLFKEGSVSGAIICFVVAAFCALGAQGLKGFTVNHDKRTYTSLSMYQLLLDNKITNPTSSDISNLFDEYEEKAKNKSVKWNLKVYKVKDDIAKCHLTDDFNISKDGDVTVELNFPKSVEETLKVGQTITVSGKVKEYAFFSDKLILEDCKIENYSKDELKVVESKKQQYEQNIQLAKDEKSSKLKDEVTSKIDDLKSSAPTYLKVGETEETSIDGVAYERKEDGLYCLDIKILTDSEIKAMVQEQEKFEKSKSAIEKYLKDISSPLNEINNLSGLLFVQAAKVLDGDTDREQAMLLNANKGLVDCALIYTADVPSEAASINKDVVEAVKKYDTSFQYYQHFASTKDQDSLALAYNDSEEANTLYDQIQNEIDSLADKYKISIE